MTSENFYWKKLLPDELAFYSAELEIMRSMLPVSLVRNKVDDKPTNGHPTEVWVYEPTDSKKCYACIWRVKNDEFIGYIETSAEKGVVCSSNVPQCAGSLPDFLNLCKPVRFKDYFWDEAKAEAKAEAEAEGKDVQTPPGDDAEKGTQDSVERKNPSERTQQAIYKIQHNYESKDVDGIQRNYEPEDVDKAKKRQTNVGDEARTKKF